MLTRASLACNAGKRGGEYRGPECWAMHSSDDDDVPDLTSDVTSSECDSDFDPDARYATPGVTVL